MRVALFVPLILLTACVATPPAPAPKIAAATSTSVPLDAAARARIEARVETQVRALEPEFWARRSKDGEVAANDWLKRQAVTIKERETTAERKALAKAS